MRIEMHGIAELEAAMDRLIRRVRDMQGPVLTDASEQVGEAFRRNAPRLTGAHADSYQSEPPRSSGDRTTVRGGPTRVYSRKASLKSKDLERAVREVGARAVKDNLVNGYNRVVR